VPIGANPSPGRCAHAHSTLRRRLLNRFNSVPAKTRPWDHAAVDGTGRKDNLGMLVTVPPSVLKVAILQPCIQPPPSRDASEADVRSITMQFSASGWPLAGRCGRAAPGYGRLRRRPARTGRPGPCRWPRHTRGLGRRVSPRRRRWSRRGRRTGQPAPCRHRRRRPRPGPFVHGGEQAGQVLQPPGRLRRRAGSGRRPPGRRPGSLSVHRQITRPTDSETIAAASAATTFGCVWTRRAREVPGLPAWSTSPARGQVSTGNE
jgi:hypothetical protein